MARTEAPMTMIKYTVFVDHELWVNVVDDLNSASSWAMGGIIFLDKWRAEDFITNLRTYYDAWRESVMEVVEVHIHHA